MKIRKLIELLTDLDPESEIGIGTIDQNGWISDIDEQLFECPVDNQRVIVLSVADTTINEEEVDTQELTTACCSGDSYCRTHNPSGRIV